MAVHRAFLSRLIFFRSSSDSCTCCCWATIWFSCLIATLTKIAEHPTVTRRQIVPRMAAMMCAVLKENFHAMPKTKLNTNHTEMVGGKSTAGVTHFLYQYGTKTATVLSKLTNIWLRSEPVPAIANRTWEASNVAQRGLSNTKCSIFLAMNDGCSSALTSKSQTASKRRTKSELWRREWFREMAKITRVFPGTPTRTPKALRKEEKIIPTRTPVVIWTSLPLKLNAIHASRNSLTLGATEESISRGELIASLSFAEPRKMVSTHKGNPHRRYDWITRGRIETETPVVLVFCGLHLLWNKKGVHIATSLSQTICWPRWTPMKNSLNCQPHAGKSSVVFRVRFICFFLKLLFRTNDARPNLSVRHSHAKGFLQKMCLFRILIKMPFTMDYVSGEAAGEIRNSTLGSERLVNLWAQQPYQTRTFQVRHRHAKKGQQSCSLLICRVLFRLYWNKTNESTARTREKEKESTVWSRLSLFWPLVCRRADLGIIREIEVEMI